MKTKDGGFRNEEQGTEDEGRKQELSSSNLEPRSSFLSRAREISWRELGKKIVFYVPGMFKLNGICGSYPCFSITGRECALQCDHCRGSLLTEMIPAMTPERLLGECLRMAEKRVEGVLLSGGSDSEGRLPWATFISAIAEIKKKTSLFISIHSGLVDEDTALRLKEAGVDQALIDVVGDDETYQTVCHVPFGVSRIAATLESFQKAGLPVIPHIVCGLHYGEIKGERGAIDMIAQFEVEQVVVVSLMQGSHAPKYARKVKAEEVAEVIAGLRFRMPRVLVSLGCARERGNTRMELLALEAGVNRMALPSEETIRRAGEYGLEVRYQKTCCSVSLDLSREEW
jgi:lipoyl synthase